MNYSQDPDKATEEFLNEVRTKTGVSERFINAARPLVRRAFVEVLPDRLESCLASLMRAFSRQAEIEALATEARVALENSKKKLNTMVNTNLFGAQQKQLMN